MTTTHSHIDVCDYAAWFIVHTVHGNRLEFMLSDADDRKGESRNFGHVTTTYTGFLFDMLNVEFKDEKNMKVVELQEYGDVMFRIEADTIPELQAAIDRCNKVTKKWINKYNVNKMRG